MSDTKKLTPETAQAAVGDVYSWHHNLNTAPKVIPEGRSLLGFSAEETDFPHAVEWEEYPLEEQETLGPGYWSYADPNIADIVAGIEDPENWHWMLVSHPMALN